jgi:1-phosphofructokinase family hexose kinase
MVPRLLAVAPNPSLDHTMLVQPGAAGPTRASAAVEAPGGKPVHAALIAAQVGAEPTVVAAVGGYAGTRFSDLVGAAGVKTILTPLQAGPRLTFTIIENAEMEPVQVIGPPVVMTSDEVSTFLADVQAACSRERVVVTGGSLADGLPLDFFARITRWTREAGGIAIVDAAGEALVAALQERPDVVVPNALEASRAVGDAEMSDPATLAETLLERGAQAAVVTAGSSGSVIATREGVWQFTMPGGIAVQNVVGCGDAYAGGMASRLASGQDAVAAASFGHACACAKAEQLSPATVDRARAEQLHAVSTPLRLR